MCPPFALPCSSCSSSRLCSLLLLRAMAHSQGASVLPPPALLRRLRPRRCASLAARPSALFGPSKREVELQYEVGARSREAAEATRRAAELSQRLAEETAKRRSAEEARDALQVRLRDAEKEVFKLEKQLEARGRRGRRGARARRRPRLGSACRGARSHHALRSTTRAHLGCSRDRRLLESSGRLKPSRSARLRC